MGARGILEHYTYEDYKLWEGDWELIGGVAYAMAPSPVKRYQNLNVKIVTQLEEAFENCPECEVLVEEDYKIAEDTVVCQNIAVVCDDENENYIAKAPLIVVEIISPKTARRDEVIKFSLYEKEGDSSHETYEFTKSKCPAKIDFARVFKKYRK
ncbi:Uma2 family endonuclease [Nitratiruptor sp. YY09-18]|uniref:Uma2 family endonuclease n=1 Tax=Nitratiruptor sp. YY09-18 TaxID=2724901 RepID=UPI0019154FE0|nr:Uma2 family endonuclease [Nitratiruptor sp. YY09-18]BCD67253.1 hypothetical protein NitYY0918_C0124 [Nitratiruptor sp. YY09-18]